MSDNKEEGIWYLAILHGDDEDGELCASCLWSRDADEAEALEGKMCKGYVVVSVVPFPNFPSSTIGKMLSCVFTDRGDDILSTRQWLEKLCTAIARESVSFTLNQVKRGQIEITLSPANLPPANKK